MISFILNGKNETFTGDTSIDLLTYLRNFKHITSAKDGCSGQGTCGACTVDINGNAKLACMTKMSKLNNANIKTIEGIEPLVKEIIAKSFVKCGAVQCGFCSPGFIMRTKILLMKNPNPTDSEIKTALKPNLCRCTGYKKIIDGVKMAAESLKNKSIPDITNKEAFIGKAYKKYMAYETALGQRNFTDDIFLDGMAYGALKFSDYPRAKIISINIKQASELEGVIKIFLAHDIPGERYQGLIFKDWPMMIAAGETTNYIGDVLAGVVAINEEIARQAIGLIEIEYEIYEPVTDPLAATKKDSPQVHEGQDNCLENCIINIGKANEMLEKADYTAKGTFETQRIEHAFLEKECAVAISNEIGVKIFSQGQGVYVDRTQIASILNLKEENIIVELVPNGGGFGGKEDLSVQGHAALFSYLLNTPVKVSLTRSESIRMHPKRHPIYMEMEVGANKYGKLTALKLFAVGDTGAYASVGTKVLERVAGHASAGYFIPNIDLKAKTVYTNNIPCGAMRGFGANQVNFAIESCIDMICEKGGFDRWQFRYDNALDDGLKTATGQKLSGVGIKKCLLALKDDFEKAKYAGIATGIKNSGVGNGMPDFSDVIIKFVSEKKIEIHHGWTEMGQGVHNMAIQTLCQETGLDAEIIEVKVNTSVNLVTGMTTSSRGTALLGNAIIDAAKNIRKDLKNHSFNDLIGKSFKGKFKCDWTTKPGTNVNEQITHYSYGYAAQLCMLDENGKIDTFIAAHDAGKIMNPVMFEGQIEGAVMMGVGYALQENLPMKKSQLVSDKLKDCKVPRITDMPKIVVKGIEVKDEVGPYGAKGIGEIGLVPTASAIANAFYQYDKIRRYQLPLESIKQK